MEHYVLKSFLLGALFIGATLAEADPVMVSLPAGSLRMGSSDFPQTQPIHSVTLKAFAIAKNPVTRGEYQQFVDATGHDAGNGWRKPRFAQTDSDPVVNVSWSDAQAYIAWLNQKTQQHFRLPTEAEFEYAARAGTTTNYPWGDDIGKAHASCNDCGNAWDGDRTAPVGSFSANAWGLFDMVGNAAQWLQDCYIDNYQNAPADGSAVSGGECKSRVVRGGGWNDSPKALRVDVRDGNLADFRYSNVGFRLAQDVSP